MAGGAVGEVWGGRVGWRGGDAGLVRGVLGCTLALFWLRRGGWEGRRKGGEPGGEGLDEGWADVSEETAKV